MDTSDVRKRMMNRSAERLLATQEALNQIQERKDALQRRLMLFPHVVDRQQPQPGDHIIDVNGVVHIAMQAQGRRILTGYEGVLANTPQTPTINESDIETCPVIGSKDHLRL